jgi:DNA replication protein DnaC
MGRRRSKLSNAQSQKAAEAKTQNASSNTQTIYNTPAEGIQFQKHLNLLQRAPVQRDVEDVMVAPLFTMSALRQVKKVAQGAHGQLYSQYGLLAGINNNSKQQQQDPRIFYNVTSPSSLFICGSQGSGKSHTLSCLLENCLIPSDASVLSRPLAGLVFHYDSFISDDGGSPCEAAFLASDSKVKVRVLCSPTNIRTIEVWSWLIV